MTTRLNALLALALVATSLYLVKTSHDARVLFAEVDRARTEEARLDADFKRLEAERQQQATTERVERTASERLHMRRAHPGVTQIVYDPAGPGATATADASSRAPVAPKPSSPGAAR